MDTNTMILLIIDPDEPRLAMIEDPRPIDELIKLINTGQLVVGADQPGVAGRRQWAFRLDPAKMISVALEPPPVELSPRLYDVLFGLAQGLFAEQIAAQLGISRRRVYECFHLLKERFQVSNNLQLLVKAIDCGYLWIDELLCLSSDYNDPFTQEETDHLADDEEFDRH